MAYDKRISLDPRLSMIADLVGTCNTCADIGSDHGRLGAFLLQTGRCDRMLLTDISSASLDKARRLIALLGLNNRTEFCVGNGAVALTRRADVAVIAGMGGETISDIVENADGHLDGSRLVLQPNVAPEHLRRTLCRAGWRIEDEHLARDGRRIYPIICAKQGKMELSEAEEIIGPVLLRGSDRESADYRAFKIRVLEKALSGARSGAATFAADAIARELDIWKGWNIP